MNEINKTYLQLSNAKNQLIKDLINSYTEQGMDENSIRDLIKRKFGADLTSDVALNPILAQNGTLIDSDSYLDFLFRLDSNLNSLFTDAQVLDKLLYSAQSSILHNEILNLRELVKSYNNEYRRLQFLNESSEGYSDIFLETFKSKESSSSNNTFIDKTTESLILSPVENSIIFNKVEIIESESTKGIKIGGHDLSLAIDKNNDSYFEYQVEEQNISEANLTLQFSCSDLPEINKIDFYFTKEFPIEIYSIQYSINDTWFDINLSSLEKINNDIADDSGHIGIRFPSVYTNKLKVKLIQKTYNNKKYTFQIKEVSFFKVTYQNKGTWSKRLDILNNKNIGQLVLKTDEFPIYHKSFNQIRENQIGSSILYELEATDIKFPLLKLNQSQIVMERLEYDRTNSFAPLQFRAHSIAYNSGYSIANAKIEIYFNGVQLEFGSQWWTNDTDGEHSSEVVPIENENITKIYFSDDLSMLITTATITASYIPVHIYEQDSLIGINKQSQITDIDPIVILNPNNTLEFSDGLLIKDATLTIKMYNNTILSEITDTPEIREIVIPFITMDKVKDFDI